MSKKIAVSLTTFAKYDRKPLNLLEEQGWDVLLNPHGRRLTSDEVLDLAQEADGLIAGIESLTSDVLNQMKSLKVISRCGVGIENVDIEGAKRLGIKVFNTPDGPTLAVAELVIGLAFNLLRSISKMDKDIRNGHWKKEKGKLFSEKVFGIIGMGRIGQAVAQYASNLRAKIVFHDPFVEEEVFANYRKMELNELLANADIISIHVPYSEQTANLISKKEFSMMKSDSFLINCSRGGIVDESTLYEILKDGKIAGAAMDVFEEEPYQGRLKELDNIILTPHIGSYAIEARSSMELEAVKNLINGLNE